MVDVVVSTAGGIEEDFIKCLAPTYIGDFKLDGQTLRKKGINRTGNLLVPNDNYVKFEDWMKPILDAMLVEQQRDGVVWTPSKMIHRFGKVTRSTVPIVSNRVARSGTQPNQFPPKRTFKAACSSSHYVFFLVGNRRREVRVLLGVQEQYPRVLACTHRRLYRRSDLLPFFQQPWTRAGHCW
jgi:hypothetical protein